MFLLLALPAALQAREAQVLHDFGAEGFQVAYEEWKDKPVLQGGATVLKATSKGGGLVNRAYDLSGWAGGTPALTLKVLAGNEEPALHLVLRDGSGYAAMWDFPLKDIKPGEQVTTVYARDAVTLGAAVGMGGKPGPNLAKLCQFHLQGSFRGGLPLAVALAKLTIEPDSPALQEVRRKVEAAKAKAAPPAAKPKPVDLTPLPRTPKSPTVEHVSLVAPGLLAIDLTAGTYVPSRLLAYKAEPGDAFVQKGNETVLKRGGKEIAWVLDDAKTMLRTFDGKEGDELQTGLADLPATYTIASTDDPAYRSGQQPSKVFRKSKPFAWPDTDKLKAPMLHTLYLALPAPLKVGATYSIAFGALNTREPTVTYRHAPDKTRSEAVHVSQIGFRPDDPAKRGYLSVWLGTGGAHRYEPAPAFRVIDDKTGAAALEGKAVLAVAADQPETYKLARNYNQTDVLRLDFSALQKPGTYRVVVDGIGSSLPFTIGREVWTEAFVKSARGFYHQRTGIKLGPPHTTFDRPLNFREEAGCRFHELSADPVEGQKKIGEDTKGYKTGKLLHGVWGGYHDAGDWDMRIHHVSASLAHLTLLELFPDFFARTKHNIPESSNALPDLLDEAVWNVGLYLRLQRADGLVYHGVEEDKWPASVRRGAPSWMYKDLVVYPPDLWTTVMYAGAAAAVAHHLQAYDAPLAAAFKSSALKAMAAFEAGQATITDAKERTRQTDARAFAAVALYRLTKDPRWHDLFKQTTALAAELPALGSGLSFVYDRQGYATFLYARLDDALADRALKAKAKAAIVLTAESELRYSQGNAFDAAHPIDSMPNILGFWTSPTVMESCWAHYLTGDPKYLETVLRAANFGAGANPANLVFTTGVGQTPVRYPLHLDSHFTGQPAPEGLTLYGIGDWKYWGQGNGFFDWGFKWVFSKQCTPNAYEWPVTEAYFDVFGFPSMNEFTVHGPMERTCFIWGYLAARK